MTGKSGRRKKTVQVPLCVGVYPDELELVRLVMAKYRMNKSAATRLLIHKGASALDVEL